MADQPITPVQESKPTFKIWLKSVAYRVGNFFIKYPFALAATVLLVAGAAFAMVFGQKIQIGGLLGWLWNRQTHDSNAIAVTPPPDRKDPTTGQLIQPGQADSIGFVQAPVVLPIKTPSIFSDPTTVTVTPPGKPEVTIKLPTGVKNKDVKHVVLVAPNTFEIANHDKGVDTGKLLKELK